VEEKIVISQDLLNENLNTKFRDLQALVDLKGYY